MFCFNCGKQIEAASNFCPHCGVSATERMARETSDTQDEVQTAQSDMHHQTSHRDAAPPSPDMVAYQQPIVPQQPTEPYSQYASSPTSSTEKPPKRKRKAAIIIIAAAIAICAGAAAWSFMPGTTKNDYWPRGAPDMRTVETSLWEFDIDDIFDYDLAIISVSPSGKYILAADQITISAGDRFAAGIPNSLGRLPDCLYVFSRENRSYRLTYSIEINPDRDMEFSSTLGVAREDGVAWNEDETQALITVGLIQSRQYFTNTHSNIFLVDFAKDMYENLTMRKDSHNTLPQWADNDNIRFIRYEMEDDWRISLISMNIKTGREDVLSDLVYDADGRPGIVHDYAVHGETVYFSRDVGGFDYSGFYSANISESRGSPRQLLGSLELREDIHPYSRMISSVQISPDGRWACLTVNDQRIAQRDIPLVDFDVRILLGPDATAQQVEELREAMGLNEPHSKFDPNSARSMATGLPWVPCHNVILFDLETNRIVDPFRDSALRPDVVIVTAATFAPDGKSLLCAVFGDGGIWYMADYNRTTLYQVRLDDGSFDAVRVFKTEVLSFPGRLTWLNNNSLLIDSEWYGPPPTYAVQITTPAAFERFVNAN